MKSPSSGEVMMRMQSTVVRICFVFGVLATIGFATISKAPAQVIAGTLDTTGEVALTPSAIDWRLPSGPPNGIFTVSNSSTGYFFGLGTPTQTSGFALDLNSVAHPAGVPVSVPSFLTFANPAFLGLRFELTFIYLGTQNPPAPNSPLNMVEVPGPNTSITMRMRGLVTDTANPTAISNWDGTWAMLVGMGRQDILNVWNAGGLIITSYSSNIVVTPVPEPGSVSALLIGLMPFVRKVPRLYRRV